MTSSVTVTEAHAAVDNLRERVVRLEEENVAALSAVEASAAALTAALVAGKAPDEKKHELALEERDRAARRLEAAREALHRSEAIAEKVALEDEAARAAATLEAEALLAKEIRRDLKRALLLLGVAIRAASENDARSWQARKTLQALGGDGPIESFAIPGLMFDRVLDEVGGELSSKRGGLSCDRVTVRLPY
ncbi:MAG: hypothetical protein ACYC4P_11615 [Thermoanaerobaculia bacterium]